MARQGRRKPEDFMLLRPGRTSVLKKMGMVSSVESY